jgi:hypothetical protein
MFVRVAAKKKSEPSRTRSSPQRPDDQAPRFSYGIFEAALRTAHRLVPEPQRSALLVSSNLDHEPAGRGWAIAIRPRDRRWRRIWDARDELSAVRNVQLHIGGAARV